MVWLVVGGLEYIGRMSTERVLPIVGLVGEDKMAVVGDFFSYRSVELLYY